MRTHRFFILASFVLISSEAFGKTPTNEPSLPDLIKECQTIAQRGHYAAEPYSDVTRHKKAMAAICGEWRKIADRRATERKAAAEDLHRLCTREAMSGREAGSSGSRPDTPHKMESVAICDRLFETVMD